jgi:Autotransporter beta-domain
MIFNKILKHVLYTLSAFAITSYSYDAMAIGGSGSGGGSGAATTSTVNGFNGGGSLATSYNAYNNSALNASSVVIAHDTLRLAAASEIQAISAYITQTHNDHAHGSGRYANLIDTGKNAGSQDSKIRGWSNIVWRNIKNTAEQYQWNGDLYQLTAGSDYKFSNYFLAGLALRYAFFDAKTHFNQGSEKSNGFGATPYAIIQFNNNFAVEGVFGYTHIERDDKRKNIQEGYNSSTSTRILAPMNDITGKIKSDRIIAGIFARVAHHIINKTSLSYKIGYIYAKEKGKAFKEVGVGANSYTANDLQNELQTLANELSFVYQINQNFAPYLNITYAYDVKSLKPYTFEKEYPSSIDRTKVFIPKSQETNRNTYGVGVGFKVKINECSNIEAGYDYEKKGDLQGQTVNLKIVHKF